MSVRFSKLDNKDDKLAKLILASLVRSARQSPSWGGYASTFKTAGRRFSRDLLIEVDVEANNKLHWSMGHCICDKATCVAELAALIAQSRKTASGRLVIASIKRSIKE